MINIGILTFPMAQANLKPSSNFVNIIQALSNNIFIIIVYNKEIPIHEDGKNREIYKICHKSGKNPLNRISNYILTQLRISYKFAKLSKDVDLWFFYIGDTAVVPMIIAKILRKRVILAVAGFMEKEIELKNDFIAKILKPFKRINLAFSDGIILYSPNLIKEWNLEKYQNKISIAHEHFLDFDKFKIKKNFYERDNLVGYIGRLSEEKGVWEFVKAIPQITKENAEIKVLIGGDGLLRDKIEAFLNENNLNSKVKLVGWIPQDELPDYLNELKLIVLPSYTEGLPNIMLEAMACGTLVLATPVGAIPDVIRDGETGFIVENNSPECIAKNIMRVLNYQNLDRIVKNANELIRKEFTYEAATEWYRKILENI